MSQRTESITLSDFLAEMNRPRPSRHESLAATARAVPQPATRASRQSMRHRNDSSSLDSVGRRNAACRATRRHPSSRVSPYAADVSSSSDSTTSRPRKRQRKQRSAFNSPPSPLHAETPNTIDFDLDITGPLSPLSFTLTESGPSSPRPTFDEAATSEGASKEPTAKDAKPHKRKPLAPDTLLAEVLNCPVCMSPPKGATLTPCGHVMCGECLFMSVAGGMQRARVAMNGRPEPQCPVCRARIDGWDGRGGGLTGLTFETVNNV
ncbi:hypothetical protein BKA62DRAFT_684274 [Auriculariales sp. MPI-PUGE-AT-0066]|nr:hypothetical protein BKA62DRAFT_684274 [Auriculariales sp. MPI-PUGE-AT-0066]